MGFFSFMCCTAREDDEDDKKSGAPQRSISAPRPVNPQDEDLPAQDTDASSSSQAAQQEKNAPSTPLTPKEVNSAQQAAEVIQKRHRLIAITKNNRRKSYRSSPIQVVEELQKDGSGDQEGINQQRMLTVEVLGASNLRDVSYTVFQKRVFSSPLLLGEIGDIAFQTRIIRDSRSPFWNEAFEIVDYELNKPLIFHILHNGKAEKSKVSLGTAELEASKFESGFDGEIKINDELDPNGTATLRLKVSKSSVKAETTTLRKPRTQTWITCFRPIGLRAGPGEQEARVEGELAPGEEFLVTDIVKGPKNQCYLRLADGRGWAFSRSMRDGDTLAEPLNQPVGDNNEGRRRGKRFTDVVHDAMMEVELQKAARAAGTPS
eukprot:TRINITY_DN14725_c0_g1_i2.p1 TRINITY_DN14725_c0_g1~~TRINITY_DN14725_c0_g1_i2.p1  ORF type:complete len:376 (+),score=89.10 TRINITY_DN14725_c0_g1_i2:36-1163(+)